MSGVAKQGFGQTGVQIGDRAFNIQAEMADWGQ